MEFETSSRASFYFKTVKPRLNKSEMLFKISRTTLISFPGPYLKIPPFSSSGNSAAMSSRLKEQNISLCQNHSRKAHLGMSVRVTGNLPWSPGGIIEHCSPSVGRGPVEEIPKVRFPPFSKSPTGEISFPCFVFLEPWSPPISCFSSFSRSIACKMCLRYLNDHYSTEVPKYPILSFRLM